MKRPTSVPGTTAGAERLGGWVAPDGTFYPAQWLHHLRVAAELRATGGGPADPWLMRDGWVMVRATGEVIALPGRAAQVQFDTLGDMLCAAPPGSYRSELRKSLRTLLELTANCP